MQPVQLPIFPVNFVRPQSIDEWLDLAKVHHIRIEVPENAEEEIKEELAWRSSLTKIMKQSLNDFAVTTDALSENADALVKWPLIWADANKMVRLCYEDSYIAASEDRYFATSVKVQLYLMKNGAHTSQNYHFSGDWGEPFIAENPDYNLFNLPEKLQRDYVVTLGNMIKEARGHRSNFTAEDSLFLFRAKLVSLEKMRPDIYALFALAAGYSKNEKIM